MSVFSGDFLGFTLGDIHSSQLNITRVSVSDRYEDNLLPTFKDTVMEVPGGDGTYYWDTFYTQRVFTLSFAYDDLRDEDLRALRQAFGFKGVQPLIFDELPYKKYLVKCQSPPNFKYICFDHMEMRLFKGEGSATLIAYYPFAFATFSPAIWKNKIAMLNNVGDLPAEIKIIYSLTDAANLSSITLTNLEEDTVLGQMGFTDIQKEGDNDAYILINSKTHLIEGLDSKKKKTGYLYNKYLTSGDFFDVPLNRTKLTSNVKFEKVQYTPLYY